MSLVKASTQTHPMAIYRSEENHLGQLIQQHFRIIPRKAIPQTRAQSRKPVRPFNTIVQMGVYVPAIRIKIIQ